MLSLSAEAHPPLTRTNFQESLGGHVPPAVGSLFTPQPQSPAATASRSAPASSSNSLNNWPTPSLSNVSYSPALGSAPPSSNLSPLANDLLTTSSAAKTPWNSWFSRRPYALALSFVAIMVLGSGMFGLSKLLHSTSSPSSSQLASQTDQALGADLAASTLTLNLDTVVAKGKTLTILGQLTGPTVGGLTTLQVAGDLQASGTLAASGGTTFLNNAGLVINKVTVCTAAGCIPNVTISPVTSPSGVVAPVAATTGAGAGNTTKIPDSSLSANVALLDGSGPQTFSGNNKFTGNFLIQNAADSTTAFQIQNATGTSNLLVANTTSSRIAIAQASANYTLDVAGDINSTTGVRVNGALLCNAGGCTAAGGSGNYIQNGIALQSANFNINSASTSSVTGTIRAATGQTADLLQLKDQAGVNLLTIGPGGNTLIKPSTNSINAFSVQNAAGTSLLIGGDTLNARVAIATSVPPNYTLDVGGDINTSTGLRVNGNLVCSTVCTPGSGSGSYIQNGTTVQTANYAIQSAVGTSIGAYIRGASGQSADLLDVVGIGVGNTILPVATFSASGNILFQNAIDSTTAFRLQNLAGSNYLLVNTSGASVSLGDAGIASTVQIGNTTGAVAQTINIGNNGTALSTNTIHLGDGATATNTITIGSASNVSNSLTLEAGTGTTALFNGATAHTIQLATGGAIQAVTIGSTNSTSSLTLQAGSGNLNIGNDAVAKTTTINIGAEATGADLVALGSTNAGSTLILEGGTVATAIQIGNGATAHGIQIGTGGAVQTITLGSTNTTSATSIQGGTGAGAIGLSAGTAGTISIGTTNVNTVTVGSTANTGTLTLGQATTGETINIGNGNVATGKTNTINIGATATSTGKNVIIIGSTVAASSLTLQGGSGNISINATAGTVTLQTTTSGAINITPASVDGINIVLGTSDTVGTLLVLDTKTGAGDPTTCTNGGLYYNSNINRIRGCANSVWGSLINNELARAQRTTSTGDITATLEATAVNVLSVTVTLADTNPITIEFFAPAVEAPASQGAKSTLILKEGATVLGQIAVVQDPVAGGSRIMMPVKASFDIDSPTAATHTYDVNMYVSIGASGVFGGGGGSSTYVPITLKVLPRNP